MESIIQVHKQCFVCGTTYNLHKHHIFYGTSNRRNSEETGCWCWLCARHHNMSNEGVHFSKDLDSALKEYAQRKFEAKKGTREDFRRIFGRSWI